MSHKDHYFIAIPLPESIQCFLSIWQEELKEKLHYKLWPDQADLHITLKFLGPVDDNKRKQLEQALQSITDFKAFTIDVGSMGTFGKPSMPRVLWAGVDKTFELTALQEQVEARLATAGFPVESRAYRPHITLAKKWQGDAEGDLLDKIIEHYTTKQKLLVETIVLYRIHPTSKPKYEAVSKYRLQGGE